MATDSDPLPGEAFFVRHRFYACASSSAVKRSRIDCNVTPLPPILSSPLPTTSSPSTKGSVCVIVEKATVLSLLMVSNEPLQRTPTRLLL